MIINCDKQDCRQCRFHRCYLSKEKGMTREEAIKVLSSYDVNGVWADVDGKPYNAEEQAEAFDMAIEALQAEPVKHGKWEKTEVAGGKIYVCSECSEAIYKSTFEENVHYYCNNCCKHMERMPINSM